MKDPKQPYKTSGLQLGKSSGLQLYNRQPYKRPRRQLRWKRGSAALLPQFLEESKTLGLGSLAKVSTLLPLLVLISPVALYSCTLLPQSEEATVTEVTIPEPTSINALGRLEPEGDIIQLFPQDSNAPLGQLLVNVGDRVSQGQRVAVMDNLRSRQLAVETAAAKVAISQARLLQVEAGEAAGTITAQRDKVAELEAQLQGDLNIQATIIERRQIELEKARSEFERYQELEADGAVAGSETDDRRLQMQILQKQLQESEATLQQTLATGQERIQQAQANLAALADVRIVDISVTQAELEETLAQLRKAEADLENSYVTSPVNGTVLSIGTKIGEKVSPQGIMELGQTQQMLAVAEVYESDIRYIQVGQPATVISEYGGFTGELQGVVETIGLKIDKPGISNQEDLAQADVRVVQVQVRLDPADSDRVKTLNNLQVRVSIDLS
jgi:HlyD family secretion protein